MARRRLRFAAPLVIITACGQAAPGVMPVDPSAELGIAATSPIDATPPPPVDAGIDAVPRLVDGIEPQPGTIAIKIPGRLVQPRGFVSCHDFGPGSRGCNPPRPYREEPTVIHARFSDVTRTATTLRVKTLTAGGAFARTTFRVVEPATLSRQRRLVTVAGRIADFDLDPLIDDETLRAGRVVVELDPADP